MIILYMVYQIKVKESRNAVMNTKHNWYFLNWICNVIIHRSDAMKFTLTLVRNKTLLS